MILLPVMQNTEYRCLLVIFDFAHCICFIQYCPDTNAIAPGPGLSLCPLRWCPVRLLTTLTAFVHCGTVIEENVRLKSILHASPPFSAFKMAPFPWYMIDIGVYGHPNYVTTRKNNPVVLNKRSYKHQILEGNLRFQCHLSRNRSA